MSRLMDVHDAIRTLLDAHVGQSVSDLAAAVGATSINLSAKNAHAVTIRRLFEERGLAPGLEEVGATPKVVRRGPDGRVFEKMTFRNFDHDELPREKWETSRFRTDTRRLMIVVFEAEKRGLAMSEHYLMGGSSWSPSLEEDRLMESAWRLCRESVAYGTEAPREADVAVHIGSKGGDSFDLEELNSGELVPKQCLCLSKWFVEELLGKYGP